MTCLASIIFIYVAALLQDKVELDELDNKMSDVIRAAWADTTLATRNSQWGRYIRFCKANGLQPVPGTVITVARFLIHLGSCCVFSTCNNYLSAIIALHKFIGYPSDYREYFVIKLVLKGLAKHLCPNVNQKIGLTPSIFKSIYDVLDFSDVNFLTKWAALIFSFRSLLRKSNVVQTSLKELSLVVDRSDIIFSPRGMLVKVRKPKTIQCPVSYVSHLCFDIVSMLNAHFFRTPHFFTGPLFYLFH